MALADILREMPDGWVLFHVKNYAWDTLANMRAWLEVSVETPHREVNWQAGCSYSTGVMFEDDVEACLFKLRWS